MGNCILFKYKDIKDDVYEPITELYYSPDEKFTTSVNFIGTNLIKSYVPETPFVSTR